MSDWHNYSFGCFYWDGAFQKVKDSILPKYLKKDRRVWNKHDTKFGRGVERLEPKNIWIS